MAATERIALLDVGLDLTRYVSEEERAELARVGLPLITVDHGALDLPAMLAQHAAFGAILIDGIVMSALRIGEQTGIQLLGPGDLLMPPTDALPDWLSEPQFRSVAPVRVGLFGRDLLAALSRWPRAIQGMYAGIADQLARLRAQLVICQLPRVDERLLAMLWLLAQAWGHVTPAGVRLPLTLTHETLGALIGARRPTVTLALRKLTDEGSIVHQDSGWLLLEPPAEPVQPGPTLLPPEIADMRLGPWAPSPPTDGGPNYAEMRAVLHALREQHAIDRQAFRDRLEQTRESRVRLLAMRERIEQDALKRRQPPSS